MSKALSMPAQLWYCSRCRQNSSFVRIPVAAQTAGVSTKTIYRYIEEGSVYAIRIAGKTYRVCLTCLIQPDIS
jgi:excisionase family DNA binding protein